MKNAGPKCNRDQVVILPNATGLAFDEGGPVTLLIGDDAVPGRSYGLGWLAGVFTAWRVGSLSISTAQAWPCLPRPTKGEVPARIVANGNDHRYDARLLEGSVE